MSNWQRFYSVAALALAVVRLTEKFVILNISVKFLVHSLNDVAAFIAQLLCRAQFLQGDTYTAVVGVRSVLAIFFLFFG